MNLKEFVRNALVEIETAINDANEISSREIRFFGSKDRPTVEFDVAVSVEHSTSANGGTDIRVVPLLRISGDAKASKSSSSVSRITFAVEIAPITKAASDSSFPTPSPQEQMIVGDLSAAKF